MVKINVNKPLKNIVSMVKGGKKHIFRVKYGHLHDWRAICGHLNHMLKEHGYGIRPPKALSFKNLHATWFMGPGLGNGRGRRIGRGRDSMSGRGRGVAGDFKSKDLTWTWMMLI